MPLDGGNLIFYAVLIAPGFIAVMTTVRLAALENQIPSFVLLIWSLVLSLLIDTVFLAAYQWWHGAVTSYQDLSGILFDPFFRADYILLIFGLSVVVGVIGAAGVMAAVPERIRRAMQSPSRVKYNPRQPWANFMDDAWSVRIKTSDDQLYVGTVTEWSRAGRPKELRVQEPYRYNSDIGDFEPVLESGNEEMLFFEKDIDRLVLLTHDLFPTRWERLKAWLLGRELEDWSEDVEGGAKEKSAELESEEDNETAEDAGR